MMAQGKQASRRVCTSGGVILLLLILLLALGLRLYRLDGQSLWYDEGTSVVLAQRDVPAILQGAAADIHPPLYYIILHAWMRLFGSSEVAVRLLSVFAGVGVVGVVYLLGRRLFGQKTALAAGLLAALSPFLVYYSQEARMYILAALLGATSVFLMLSLVQRGRMKPDGVSQAAPLLRIPLLPVPLLWTFLAYIVVSTAALYTHYFAATVVLAQDVALAIMLVGTMTEGARSHQVSTDVGALQAHPALSGVAAPLRCRLKALAPLLIAQTVVALLYLPWLPVMASQFSQWPAISEFYNLPALVTRLFPIFSLGLSAASVSRMVLLAFAAVLIAGILPLAGGSKPGQRDGESVIVVLSWLLVPILTMFALSLRRPLYNPKFLLLAAPAFCLLLGRGLSWLWGALQGCRGQWLSRALDAGALAILVASSFLSLQAYYGDPRYARDNYRAIAQTIETLARPGDAIILNAPGQADIFGYYNKSTLAVHPLPTQRPLDEQQTLAALSELAARSSRLWVVYYGDQQADPRRVIESWLDGHGFKASDRWYGNVRLALYALPTATAGDMQPLDIGFGPSIRLVGYRLGADRLAAGDIAPLTLYWQAGAALAERYQVFVHVIDQNNALWGQRDSEPGSGLRPTTTWAPGEIVQDNYGLPVLAGTPPGEYQIEIGLYQPASGQRLPVTASTGQALGDRVLLGLLIVVRPAIPPQAGELGMQHESSAGFGALRLLGYNLGRLGDDTATSDFSGNDVLHLTLFWRPQSQPLPEMVVTVQVVDSRGQLVRQAQTRPPTANWLAGDAVRDQYQLPLSGIVAGQYRLVLDVQDGAGRRLGQETLTRVNVK